MAQNTPWLFRYLSSSVGKKTIMAGTGVALTLFLIVHMAGHLIMFLGPDAYNTYAENMQNNPIKWPARFGLLGVFVLHILTAIQLTRANRNARPVRYSFSHTIQASLASRTMIYSGMTITAFVVYHLAHFTLFWVQDTGPHLDASGRHDVFQRMVVAFHDPLVLGVYFVAMVLLGMHLIHGLSSFWQSLGLNHRKYQFAIEKCGILGVIVIIGGFLAVPAAILIGVIK